MPGEMTSADVEAMRRLVDDVLPEHFKPMKQSELTEKLVQEKLAELGSRLEGSTEG